MSDTPEKKIDSEIFVPEGKVKLLDGTEMEIPKLSWGNEIKCGRAFAKIVTEISKTGFFKTGEKFTTDELIKVIPTLTEKLDLVSEIAGGVLGKDVKWVNDNLDITGIIEVIKLFLAHISTVQKTALSGLNLFGRTPAEKEKKE